MSTLTNELSNLIWQRDALSDLIDTEQASFDTQSASVDAQIASLQAAADQAANAMRAAFAAAATAAASKETRGMAAALAAQGRGYQAQAVGLNAQANGLRGDLKEKRGELRALRSELRQLNERIAELRKNRRPKRRQRQTDIDKSHIRHIRISGFENARGIDQAAVERTLAELPRKLTAEINVVTYVNGFEKMRMAAGLTTGLLGSGEVNIYLYDTFHYESELRKEAQRETLVHEAGHVLFERLVTSSDRLSWGEMFNLSMRYGDRMITEYAKESKREDFAECFMAYRLRPKSLYLRSRRRYDFIERLLKEISK